MGEALRNTTLVSRPSDMFFLPSAAPADADPAAAHGPGGDAPLGPTTDAASETPGATDVSRETSSEGTAAAAAKANSASVTGAEDEGLPVEPSGTASVAPPGANAKHATAGSPSDVSRETGTPSDVSRETPTRSDDSRETGGEPELASVPGATFAEIPTASIHPNRRQPRQVFDEEELAELAYSVRELGVLQPIVVRPSRENGEESYELVMGERRWRATQRAGLETIPAIVRETSDDDLLRDALLENLHRSQLNPLEEAAAYQQLLEEFGATQEELSRRIGRSRPQISNTIRLLKLPPLVQRRVAAGVLSSGHARALLSLADPAAMERLAQRIVAEGLSVRATEEAVAMADGSGPSRKRTPAPAGRHQERLDYIAEAFSDRLDTAVKIALGSRKGRMTIEFASVEDLNRIIEVLDPNVDRS
ncbi:ParB/RepB/Spo0J family partition protein [Kocuria dechangensis]|nr:ParB/RepB/Spo0J family partition protein [Kocuria dechangensis]